MKSPNLSISPGPRREVPESRADRDREIGVSVDLDNGSFKLTKVTILQRRSFLTRLERSMMELIVIRREKYKKSVLQYLNHANLMLGAKSILAATTICLLLTSQ